MLSPPGSDRLNQDGLFAGLVSSAHRASLDVGAGSTSSVFASAGWGWSDDVTSIATFPPLRTGGPDLVVQFDLDTEPSWLESIDGELKFGAGTHASPDLFIDAIGDLAAPAVIHGERGSVPYTALRARTADIESRPLPPFDVDLGGGIGDVVAGASLIVQHVSFDTPVGTIRYTDHFENGQLTARVPGMTEHADAIVQNRFEARMAALRPAGTIHDSFSTSRFAATDTSVLLVMAGLYERLRPLLGGRTQLDDELCKLAGHTRSRVWISAARSIR